MFSFPPATPEGVPPLPAERRLLQAESRPSQARRAAARWAFVVSVVVLTTLVRLALNPLLGRKAALIIYFPALVFSAWAGGWAGGLLALALSLLAATYFFLSPSHSLLIASHSDQLTLLIFGVVGLSVSALSSSQRNARRQAEGSAAVLRESEAVLRESEARKAAVLEVALDCIITADGEGRVLEFNPAAERTFGYARAEVLGRPIADVIVPPSLRAAHTRGLEHYCATGEGPILRQRIEVVGMRQDGSEFPVEIAIVPAAAGRVQFTAYLRDITERKQQEQERELLLQEVQANTLRQKAFLRDVLASVTEGHLLLCDAEADLPASLAALGPPVALSQAGGLRELRHLALDAAEGMAEERRHDLVTAVSEAAMNTITHGGGSGTGQVFVGPDGVVQVRIEDQGGGIALASLPKATLARGFSTKASLGHGFKMMQQVDRVYVLTGPTGTTAVLEQERNRLSPAWL